MILNPKTNVPASYINNEQSQAINIVRLVEDEKIKKGIIFDELSIEGLADPNDVQGGNNIVNEFGLTFPIVRINDVILSRYHIKSLSIQSIDIIPTISLSMIYETSAFVSKNMPKDGDMISVYIRTNTDALLYLRNDFVITSCVVTTGKYNSSSTKIDIHGKMFIPGFDSHQNSRAYTGTSKDVLKEIAKEYKMGFSFNDFDDTDDFQTWLKIKQNCSEFIKDVIEHSWKDETSFFNSWVDLYYNICFVNINKFLLSSENEETTDITFATNTLAIENLVNNDTGIENAKMTVKVLSNASDFKDSPFYIKKWEPINMSTAVSMSTGYSTTTYTFTHNQMYLNDTQQQCFQKLNNIPAYDQTKTDSFILLRGRAKYDKEKNPNNEKARVNHDFVNTYNTTIWTGVEYTLHDDDKNKTQNEWSGNVHKNYSRSPYHNKQNLDELNKIYLLVECDGLNLQIMRGERVPVYIVYNGSYDEMASNAISPNDLERNTNRFFTGYYIVDSVTITYKPGIKGDTTPYTTTYILKRREWPTPEAI